MTRHAARGVSVSSSAAADDAKRQRVTRCESATACIAVGKFDTPTNFRANCAGDLYHTLLLVRRPLQHLDQRARRPELFSSSFGNSAV